MNTINEQVKEMREKAIAFIKLKGGTAEYDEIKEHLGLSPMLHYELFERAMKTVRLIPVYGDGVVGKWEDGRDIVLARKPMWGYKLKS